MSVASIIVLFLVLETSFSTAAGCPGGFTKFRGACFKVYHQVASYDQAREFCANQGGLLAMPKDNSTDAFLMKLKNTVDPRGYFWFGLSDENWEGRWMWEDGTVLNKSAGWSNWREGQPDNHKGDEDCAHYNSVAMSGWNDLPCSDKVAKFICQTTDDVQTDSPKTTMTSLVTEQMGTSATQGSSGNLRKITFPAPRRVSNYAGLGTPLSQDLTSFTLCLHMRTDMSSYSHTSLVSYSVGSVQHANELLLFNDGGSGGRFELYVQNTKADLGALPVWDSGWHVICVTWRSSNGDWKLYADGAFRASGTGVNVGGKVRGGGTWILAQDQDTVGGSFVESQAFSGELSQVNLWDRVLTPEEIGTDWSVFCNHHGNVIDWATINIQVVGQATSDQYRCQVTSTPASVERPRTTMTSLVTDQMGTPAPQGSPDCPKDYQSFQGICYKAYNTAANFQQSIRVCGADGGTLAMPRDQKTNDFLITLKNSVDRKSPFRFGLHDRIKENVWRWMDGQELGDFTDWGPGEPNDASLGPQGEDCVEFYPPNGNKWNDRACSNRRKFICQADTTEHPGYTRVGQGAYISTYLKVFAQPKTYEDAKQACALDGGHLANVKTQALHDFLLTKIQEVDASRDYWIGLNDMTVENTWTWSDGTPVSRTFTNWAPGEPNNAGSTGDQDCGQLWKDKGFQWDDDVCRKQNYFICQIDESSYTRLQSTLELFYHIADCPEDYQPFQGICYKAHNTTATFQESLRACGADGGTLAMPRDRKTNDFLITLKNSVDRESPFRFGLHDRIKENVWRWMDGQELGDFTDWGPGEPNDAFSGQGEDCAEYYPLKKNKWNDKACHYDRKFICQVDKTEAVRVSSSSDGVRYDAKAVLESPVFSTNCSNNTLVFHYHMQGSIVPATLHVSIVGNMSNSDSELLGTFPFKVTYGQTNRVHMDFHREQPFRVVFTAELDHSVNSTDGAGQIHLYDVIVLNDKCRPTDESAAAGFFQEPTLSKGAIIGIIVVFVIVAVAIAAGIKFARGMKRQHLRLMSTSTTVLMRRDNVMFEPDAE
ncbi:MRC1 [Branchiostoma lanceolatum]|uniref:MRC1 protein n=1 Tax=Branchiostoma lanceolatum TaxID=7740 RepID=A0A8K0EKW9_BRALA|nr:MRC1 [Branchiostoma lanceolatum]